MSEIDNNEINFRKNRIKSWKKMYTDEASVKRSYDKSVTFGGLTYKSAEEVRAALARADSNRETLEDTSCKLYMTNPIYASVIDYIANMFLWRYKVTPHKSYTKSKASNKKTVTAEEFQSIYNLMLEGVEGLSIPTKFPAILTLLYMHGSVYFTTIYDEESLTVDTILLPNKYCRKVGETQYGTNIIQFDCQYFNKLGLKSDELEEFLNSFPQEIIDGYMTYLRDNTKRWVTLDPRFSSALLLNDLAIPTYIYLLGGIINYEKYQDNELKRSNNTLKYIVSHTMPHYQENLIFEMDEVESIHKSMKKIIDQGDDVRLITTYGDIAVHKIAENDTAENQILSKAYASIFDSVGFNNVVFTGDSVEAIKQSLTRDKAKTWKFIEQLTSFYTIAINNWFDFKIFEADIDILRISQYTYDDDIMTYKENATLGVGKLDYIIASGIKQKNIQDQLYLEQFLKLDALVPMQTSYTQTAEDRKSEEAGTGNSSTDKSNSVNTEVEPSGSNTEE